MTEPIDLAKFRKEITERRARIRRLIGSVLGVPATIGASLGRADPLDPNEPKPGGDTA